MPTVIHLLHASIIKLWDCILACILFPVLCVGIGGGGRFWEDDDGDRQTCHPLLLHISGSGVTSMAWEKKEEGRAAVLHACSVGRKVGEGS